MARRRGNLKACASALRVSLGAGLAGGSVSNKVILSEIGFLFFKKVFFSLITSVMDVMVWVFLALKCSSHRLASLPAAVC